MEQDHSTIWELYVLWNGKMRRPYNQSGTFWSDRIYHDTIWMWMHSNRKSIRLKGYNYSNAGYYFVTICTYAKRQMLGNVSNQQSVLSAAGNIVLNCWHSLTEFFSGVTIDSSAIMPNHFHGIIKLNSGSRISLSQIVRNFKSVSARRIRAADPTILQVWQRNY